MRLGRVSQVSPLRVLLNGDTTDAPANGPTLLLNDEVVVETIAERRFVVYPIGNVNADLLDGVDSPAFARKGRQSATVIGGESTVTLGSLGNTLNTHLSTGVYDLSSSASAPTLDWYLVHVLAHNNPVNGTQYQRQIAYRMTGNPASSAQAYTRRIEGFDPTVAGNWTPWELIHGGTPWVGLPYVNSWSDYAGGFNVGRYRRDGDGFVHLSGLIKNAVPAVASGTAICTLPVGFRPGPATELFQVTAQLGTCRIDIDAAGGIVYRTTNAQTSTDANYVSMADIPPFLAAG